MEERKIDTWTDVCKCNHCNKLIYSKKISTDGSSILYSKDLEKQDGDYYECVVTYSNEEQDIFNFCSNACLLSGMENIMKNSPLQIDIYRYNP